MSEKTERDYRNQPLTPAEIAEDARVRDAVAGEFPPVRTAAPGVSSAFAASLRDAIRDSQKGIDAIASEAGVAPSLLERFVRGERDLRISTAERVATSLGLKLVAVS